MLKINYKKDFIINKGDILFFDTNVWINLFTPAKEEDWRTEILRRKAADCYKQALEKNAKIYTSSIVVSEFVNRYLKIMYAAEKSANPMLYTGVNAYKEVFRKSKKYKEYLDEVLEIVSLNILDVAERTDDAFSSFDIDDYASRSGKENLDFNDYCIEHICRKRNYKLVTADMDYKKADTPCEVIYLTV